MSKARKTIAASSGGAEDGRLGWLDNRLKQLKIQTKGLKSKVGLAAHLHVQPSRITEIIRGERKIAANEVKPMASYLELPESLILGHITGGGVSAAQLQTVNVVGAVQAGVWMEALEWDRARWYPAPVAAIRKYAHLPQFGLEVIGTSMNQAYPEGSVVVCVKLIDLGREPNHKERVIVLRRRADGFMEATVKEFRRDEAGAFWLWPRSDDPNFQQPWKLPAPADSDDHNDDCRIYALVIGSFQPEA